MGELYLFTCVVVFNVLSDHSSSLERLHLECVNIRTAVEQSTAAHDRSTNDVHESTSEVGSVCDEDDGSVRSSDSHTQCLVSITQLDDANVAAADTQQG